MFVMKIALNDYIKFLKCSYIALNKLLFFHVQQESIFQTLIYIMPEKILAITLNISHSSFRGLGPLEII